jgi:hypothetical protein
MFGWFRKKVPSQAQLADAHEKGREMATAMFGAFDEFKTSRINPVLLAYLDVLRNALKETERTELAPPLILARAHYSNFLEEIQKLRASFDDEIAAAMSEWFGLADQLDFRADLQQYIDMRMNEGFSDLPLQGLSILTDSVDFLKPADDAFRAANPELSLQYPRPE